MWTSIRQKLETLPKLWATRDNLPTSTMREGDQMGLTYPIHNRETIRQKTITYLWKRWQKNHRDFSFKARQIPVDYPPQLLGRIITEDLVPNAITLVNPHTTNKGRVYRTRFGRC
jgi:hypothetical protein